jgi:hypothetical protein
LGKVDEAARKEWKGADETEEDLFGRPLQSWNFDAALQERRAPLAASRLEEKLES